MSISKTQKKTLVSVIILMLAVAGLALAPAKTRAAAGELDLASATAGGTAGDGSSAYSSTSADGRYVAFVSDSPNFPGYNESYQVYLKDLGTGALVLASATAGGTAGDDNSEEPSISSDGRYVAFASRAPNFPGYNESYQVYLKDLGTGALVLASATAGGTAGDDNSEEPSISSDGRYVAFYSASSNFPGYNESYQVYRKDLGTGALVLASATAGGTAGDFDSRNASISAYGRYVAFASRASNFPGYNGVFRVYRKDLATGEIDLASSDDDGMVGSDGVYAPSTSADGRYVVFESDSSDLPGYNGSVQVYRRDLATGEIGLASADAGGTEGDDWSEYPSMSADGRYVAFASRASNFPGCNQHRQVYRKDFGDPAPAPTIEYILPDTGPNTGPVHITDLRGANFGGAGPKAPSFGIPTTDPIVKLKKAGQDDITATNVIVTDANGLPGDYGSVAPAFGNQITCDFDLTGAATGKWDVYVQNPDGLSATLADGFTVTAAPHTRPVVNSVSPSSGPPGTIVTITGENFGATQASSKVTVGGVEVGVVSWSSNRIVITVPDGTRGGAVVVTTAAGGSNTDKRFTVALSTWYLAEGTTAWGFSTYITVTNPNDRKLTAKLTYMDQSPEAGRGRIAERTVNLPPLSQTTVDPRWDLGDTDFSTRVECVEGRTIALDRTMEWTGKGAPCPEAHNSIGVSAPARNWYLPEGSSDHGFETWVTVQNPNAQEAAVTLTYMTEGAGARVLEKKMPAYSRATYSMAEDIGAADASIRVTGDVPVIAERSQYRNSRREGSCSIGATAPAKDYFLAEGTTAWGFTTWVLVQNPNDSDAEVTLTYMTPGGTVEQPPFTMPANSRKNVRVNDEPGMGNTDLSTRVSSDKPIIAERATYWNGGPDGAEACHASIGLSSSHMSFYLPDGQTSGGWETYTVVQNPNPASVTVRITYLPQGGGIPVSFTDEMPAGTRRTYNMADKIASGRASITVRSLDGARPVMVERAMYWNNRGAGTNSIGGSE